MKLCTETLFRSMLIPLVMVFALAGSATANPQADEFVGNPTCADFDADNIEFKIDPPPVGDSHHTDSVLNVSISHYEVDGEGWYLDWTKNAPAHCSVNGVLVKGGNGGNYYSYDPALSGDSGLHAIIAGASGMFAQVSHVNFCYTCAEVFEGCTIGYWKNHLGSWPAGYAPGDALGGLFAGGGTDTLADALSYPGGTGIDGARRILLRQAVAAVLNAEHGDVNYAYGVAEAIAAVEAALASNDRGTMIDLAADLDAANNMGCPLN
jgi:hypothetical protein